MQCYYSGSLHLLNGKRPDDPAVEQLIASYDFEGALEPFEDNLDIDYEGGTYFIDDLKSFAKKMFEAGFPVEGEVRFGGDWCGGILFYDDGTSEELDEVGWVLNHAPLDSIVEELRRRGFALEEENTEERK